MIRRGSTSQAELSDASLESVARVLLGRMTMKEALHALRASMLGHALRECGGSRRSAARLLGVSRPAVQRMLRESPELDGIASPLPPDVE